MKVGLRMSFRWAAFQGSGVRKDSGLGILSAKRERGLV